MRKLVVLFLVVLACSCELFIPKQNYRFVYGFENEVTVSNIETQKTIKVLENRLANFGVKPEIKRFGERHIEILIEASQLNVEQVDNLISKKGDLEFWDAYKGEKFVQFLWQADQVLKELVENKKNQNEGGAKEEGKAKEKIDELLGEAVTDSAQIDPSVAGPLMSLVKGGGYPGGPVIGSFQIKDKETVLGYLNKPQVRVLLPAEMRYVKFVFGKPNKNSELIDLYALKGNKDNQPELSGAVVTDARYAFGQTGKPEVSMQMNSKGAKIWEGMTGRAFNQQSQIAIVLDNVVYSAPGVTVGAIKGGQSSISGDFTLEEAQNLAVILSSGASTLQLKLLEHTMVENK